MVELNKMQAQFGDMKESGAFYSQEHQVLTEKRRAQQAIIPKPSCLHLLRNRLGSNGISHLRLGFHESCFTVEDFFKLDGAIRCNSSLRVVEIGWQLPRRVLLRILESLTKLPSLESLSLICYTSLPSYLLQRLVSKSTLLNLELKDVAVSPRPWAKCFRTTPTTKGLITPSKDEHISTMIHHFSESLRRVALTSGVVDAECATRICAWTNSRCKPLHELSLAHSIRISPHALKILCREAACTRLNLTCCNLTNSDTLIMAKHVADSCFIDELNLTMNRISTPLDCHNHQVLSQFMIFALSHLRVLDISSCNLSREQVHDILERLAVAGADHHLRLESLTMMGIPRDCDDVGMLLNQIVRQNTRLKTLKFDVNPTTKSRSIVPSEVSAATLLEQSLAENHTLEQLEVVGLTSRRIDFYLALNRAGRSYLRQDPNESCDWPQILARASNRCDVLFWFLQNNPEQFSGSAL